MPRSKTGPVFQTDKRIRLGVWGLGRGLSFYKTCAALHLDVVAGCDFNAHMCNRFKQMYPDALVTDDADAFLSADFDAVLLATYCPAHADDAIRCLEAGKHVLSEVTAFHTMAEGVRLVEAVEKTGLVYNLAENYPFTAEQMYIARRWREGLFGELMYAEGEYVHEVRSLAYTYIDGVPIQPGYTLHNWRSWLNFHYYCTHSLGPIMHITGTRPVRVVALPGYHTLPGFPPVKGGGLGDVAPSLINMNNGAVVKNLMGGTTNDAHIFRYWGTKGAAEINHGLFLRLGGGGGSPKFQVHADWGELTPLAEKMGHGGGDFFVLYYFARQILFGEPAPWDVYSAADVTIPGILAYRSSLESGKPFDVPDFRKKAQRNRWRRDDFAQPRYDVKKGCFPAHADKQVTGTFTAIMKDLIRYALDYRAYADWAKLVDDVVEPAKVVALADRVIEDYPAMRVTLKKARALADAYSDSDGALMLRDMIDVLDAPEILRKGFLQHLKRRRASLAAKRRLRRQ
jgi:predicted dehydrogenase